MQFFFFFVKLAWYKMQILRFSVRQIGEKVVLRMFWVMRSENFSLSPHWWVICKFGFAVILVRKTH